jgi:hypothetical protein
MYIKSIDITDIRSIEHFHWELDKPDEELAGWHVLIGDNGSGKSTVLKSLALGLVGEAQAQALSQYWLEWQPSDEVTGTIYIDIYMDKQFAEPIQKPLSPELSPPSDIMVTLERDTLVMYTPFPFLKSLRHGFFSAAYGPFRRFSGGTPANKRASSRRLAHLSIFGEEIALSDALDWLKELRFKELEEDPESGILAKIRRFINQKGFLPHNVRLQEVTSNGVFFTDAKGTTILVEQLGDGYRSILSMVFDIIRHMELAYDKYDLFSDDGTKIIMPGVVLIDEVDAHLHPEWQRTIGYWLTDHFPKIQFIVTTHSPLVCQAAVRGSIWRLPAPGSDEQAHQIAPDSEAWKRLVYGDILEAYSTALFGENINRSPDAQKLFDELGELSLKEIQASLTPKQEKRLDELMNELPSTPYKDTVGARYDKTS